MPLSKEERDRRVAAGKCEQCGFNYKEGKTRKCRLCKDQNRSSRERTKQKKIAKGLCIMEGCANQPKEGCLMCQPCIDKSTAGSNRRYYKNKTAGTCRICGEDSGGKAYCSVHQPIQRAHVRRLMDRRRAAGLCIWCRKPPKQALPDKDYCEEHRIKHLASSRRVHAKRRKLVLDHYGRKCTCCGLALEAALQIDHIHGGGTKHLKEIGQSGLYRWLIKNKFPEGFQTLCVLCNWLKRNYGACVHATMPFEAMELTLEYTRKLDQILKEQH
jgi:hypothetical protein